MTTASDLVEETRRLLFSGQRENLNTLLDPISSTSATSVTFNYDLNTLAQGTYLSVDLEIMYVFSVSTTGKSATVQRGMLGTTAATHTAGALVYVNSKFPTFSIFQAINEDLNDLSSPSTGLYQTVNVDFTYNPAIQGYDLGVTNNNFTDILSVRTQIPGPSKNWVPINSYRLEQNAETSIFASGFGIILYEAGSAGLIVRVTYSAPFSSFTALSDNLTVSGLPSSAADIPPLGAGMRLTGVREIKRNFDESQGDTRRASEVPPNAQLAGYQALARERQRRIKAEADKLASSWPIKRKGLM